MLFFCLCNLLNGLIDVFLFFQWQYRYYTWNCFIIFMVTTFNYDIYLYILWPFVTSKNNIDNQMCMVSFFFIMKRKFKQFKVYLSPSPSFLFWKEILISDCQQFLQYQNKQSLLTSNHWTLQRPRLMMLEMQVLASEMHTNVAGTNRLMESNLPVPPLLVYFQLWDSRKNIESFNK